eukprot:gene17000-22887_t
MDPVRIRNRSMPVYNITPNTPPNPHPAPHSACKCQPQNLTKI